MIFGARQMPIVAQRHETQARRQKGPQGSDHGVENADQITKGQKGCARKSG